MTPLLRRFRSCWKLKLLLTLVLTILFCVPYLYLARHAFFPVRQVPAIWIDRAAGFEPRWVWVYQSVYLLTGCLPWLADSRAQLMQYLRGFAMLSLTCFAIFLFFPTKIARPEVAEPSGMYALLMLYDGPYNALPSLHAGFLYFTLAFVQRIYSRLPSGMSIVLLTWSLLILWSTLATKQHYALDLLAGIALAAICDAAAW